MKRKFIISTICLFLLCLSVAPVTANAITYYVKFNANGGSGTMSNQTFETDEEKYLSTNTFTREGYNFIGWNSNTGGTGTWYMPSKKVRNLTSTSGATVNVYAQWMNKNQSTIKIGTTEVTKDSGGNYTLDNYKKHTISVIVNNGTVDVSSKTVEYYTTAVFSLTPASGYSSATLSCTNNQSGTINNNTLRIKNITDNSVCTVTFENLLVKTTLYTDGTLIINEKLSNRAANTASHGEVINEYNPLSNSNNYVYTSNNSQPWKDAKTSITSVIIGQEIQPTSTAYWFYGLTNMTSGDFTNLNTSNVTNMNSMFYNAGSNSSVTSFILTGLDNWNTSNVTDMNYMFYKTGYDAKTWSIGDLSNWNTSRVTRMIAMFQYAGGAADIFNLDLSDWDTSKVTTMSSMFYGTGYRQFTLNLSGWDTSNVTTMYSMFYETGYAGNMQTATFSLIGLDDWDTSKVTTMEKMFYSTGAGAQVFQLDLSSWDTSNVTTMHSMFSGAGEYATTWTIGDLSNWDVSNVTTMESMFSSAGSKATANISLGNINQWDTSNVTSMRSMFSYFGQSAATFELNLSGWDTSNVTTMYSMFRGAGYSSSTLRIIGLSTWDTSKNMSFISMFESTGCESTRWSIGNLSNWFTSRSVPDAQNMFKNAARNASVSSESVGTIAVVGSVYEFAWYAQYLKMTLNFYGNWSNSCGTNCISDSGYKRAFENAATGGGAQITVNYGCDNSSLTNYIVATKSSNSNVVKGSSLCSSNYTVNVVVNNGTSNVASIRVGPSGTAEFNLTPTLSADYLSTISCTNGQIGSIESNVLKVTNVTSNTTCTVTYASAGSTTLYADGTLIINEKASDRSANITMHGTVTNEYSPLSDNNAYSFNTTSTTRAPWYAERASITRVEIGQAIYPSSTAYWFQDLNNMTSGNFTNLNTSNVTNMNSMFSCAGNASTVTSFIITGLNNWDTSNVTNMHSMFYMTGEYATTWDIGNISTWDTSNVADMAYMFYYSATNASDSITNIGSLKVYATNIFRMFEYSKYMKATITIYSSPQYGSYEGYGLAFNNAAISGDSLITVNYDCASTTILNILATKSATSNVVVGSIYGTCSVNLVVYDGTSTQSNQLISPNSDATFTITPVNSGDSGIVNCTNNQTASINGTTLIVSNVTNGTVCTVKYSNAITTLYTDGTFIINEKISDRSANITAHGAVTNEYEPISNKNNYVFTSGTSKLWDSVKTSIVKVEIGESISPIDTSYWFQDLANMSYGDFTNLDTSNVTKMYMMFYNAGSNSSVTSFKLTGLSNWNTSKVTTMYQMFRSAGKYATTWRIGNLSDWDTSNITSMYYMFYYAAYAASASMTGIGSLDIYITNIDSIFYGSKYMEADLNIYGRPTSYEGALLGSATANNALITLNYECATCGVVNDIIATKSSGSHVALGNNLEGTCPDRTINVMVNNGTVSQPSKTIANFDSTTFAITPSSGYSYPTVSCTNNQNGSINGNTLTISNVVADTTCTVTYFHATTINLTDNDATYPWVNSSGVWKSGNYNINSSTSTITSESFTLTNSGSVAFEWAVSSESASYDYLYYTIYKNGTAVSGTGTSTKIGGNYSVTNEADLVYTTVSKELDPGTYTIAFSYRKDSSAHKGLDRGYVKNIRYLN